MVTSNIKFKNSFCRNSRLIYIFLNEVKSERDRSVNSWCIKFSEIIVRDRK